MTKNTNNCFNNFKAQPLNVSCTCSVVRPAPLSLQIKRVLLAGERIARGASLNFLWRGVTQLQNAHREENRCPFSWIFLNVKMCIYGVGWGMWPCENQWSTVIIGMACSISPSPVIPEVVRSAWLECRNGTLSSVTLDSSREHLSYWLAARGFNLIRCSTTGFSPWRLTQISEQGGKSVTSSLPASV